MLAYRMEFLDDCQGPFQSLGLGFDMADEIGDPDYYTHLPAPQNDTGICRWIEPDEVCACASARQLVRWFPRRAREVLRRYHCDFVIYEVNDFVVGEHQIIFTRTTASVVHCRSV